MRRTASSARGEMTIGVFGFFSLVFEAMSASLKKPRLACAQQGASRMGAGRRPAS
jgi:hypothetical protein